MKISPMKVRIRMWPREHVREETNAQRDEAHDLAEIPSGTISESSGFGASGSSS
jgi:hypothetical protein